MTYQIEIKDRAYNSWKIFQNKEEVELEINPSSEKVFHLDIFTFSNENKIQVSNSPTRSAIHIPGVLVLNTGKTYGRKTEKGKLLYKVLPNDTHLPAFLVPYELKNVGFSKVMTNLYVTITFAEWTSEQKHPYGSVNQVIGPVNIVENFCEYQLYCKNLNLSIQNFVKETTKIIKKNMVLEKTRDFINNVREKYTNIEDRTTWRTFSIDPEESKDFDDAFSISHEEGSTNIQISIYIANVVLWAETLSLWSFFSRRVSTIYLPDKKRPMLPHILSDILCSLQEKQPRLAFTMDVFVSSETMEILDIQFKNTLIRLGKNYRYEESSLLKNLNYEKLSQVTKCVSEKEGVRYLSEINDSHDVVAYWAIFMNAVCAKKLFEKNCGIFRKTVSRDVVTNMQVPSELKTVAPIFYGSSGEYTSEITRGEIRHEMLDLDCYIHITSPIRRIVDILNMIKFQEIYEMIPISREALEFYDTWSQLSQIECINISVKNIRKVQTSCDLLQLCNDNLENKEYTGYILESGSVYIPELKNILYVKFSEKEKENIKIYEKRKFKLYLFNDEETLKKKIRLQVVS